MTARKEPRGLRNCNPGNIRKSTDVFQGEIVPSKDKDFKQFQTMAHGYRAMFKLLNTYYRAYSLKTIRQLISRWAPRSENNTQAYVSLVASYTGIAEDAPLMFAKEEMVKIVAAMSRVENGREATMTQVEDGWRMFMGG